MQERPDPGQDSARIADNRRRARRTALVIGAVAVTIYVVFILSGVLGR
ncbi:hypothetical protein [Luteimonas yindakuii]|nr:hypothetical protein [Luteimonas yindakuii]